MTHEQINTLSRQYAILRLARKAIKSVERQNQKPHRPEDADIIASEGKDNMPTGFLRENFIISTDKVVIKLNDVMQDLQAIPVNNEFGLGYCKGQIAILEFFFGSELTKEWGLPV